MTSSVIAKVYSAFTALNIAWELGLRQVILELDSLITVHFRQSYLDIHHLCYSFVWQCK